MGALTTVGDGARQRSDTSGGCPGSDAWSADMSEGHSANVEWIIANAINEQARGDPDALAAAITAALEKAGYYITPEDTALGSQPFDELTPGMRPQDVCGDGRDWKFETSEHGGDEPDNMPQAIRATDPAGRWAVYVPLTRGGKIGAPRPYSETVTELARD